MASNHARSEGDGKVRGKGPREIAVASRGDWPPYGEGSAAWPVWPSMSSITRLRVMSYLCQHRPAGSPAIARDLGIAPTTVRSVLWGLKSTWAVSVCARPAKRRRPKSSAGNIKYLDWQATDTGRKWLWRYGWVTRRIGWDLEWQAAGYESRLDVMPYDVLRDHAEPSLLRPTPLAVMWYLTRCPPEQTPTIADHCGFSYFSVHALLQKWWRLGWVEKTQNAVEPRSYFAPDFVT